MKRLFLLALVLCACTSTPPSVPPELPPSPPRGPVQAYPEPGAPIVIIDPETPADFDQEVPMRADWDSKGHGLEYTQFLLSALETLGEPLLNVAAPADAETYCPKFGALDHEKRKAFFLMLVSAMAARESSFSPTSTYTEKFADAKGVRVVSRGLLQISQESANSSRYGCKITKAEQLHDPKINLECGVKILAYWIPKDGMIGTKGAGNYLGGARYWSVLREYNPKSRDYIRGRLAALSFCK